MLSKNRKWCYDKKAYGVKAYNDLLIKQSENAGHMHIELLKITVFVLNWFCMT